MKKLALHWQIIIGLIAGIIWVLISSSLGLSKFTINWIGPWGSIFINLLKLIAVPLVLFSIIKGVSDLSDSGTIGRLGAKTLVTYLITTVAAVSIGLLLVNTIKPGNFIDEEQRIVNRISYEIWIQETPDVEILDGKNYLSNPKYANYVSKAQEKLAQDYSNESVKSKIKSAKSTKDAGPLQFLVDMVPSNIFLSLNNNGLMLQVIFFAIFFGIVMILLPKETVAPVSKLVTSLNEVFLKMVHVVMKGAPFFVFALLAGKLSELAGDDLNKVIEIFKGIAWYSLVVVLGLGIMIFVIYPILVSFIYSRKSKKSFVESFKYFNQGISPAQLMAFSTSSSMATLPVTMDCVHERLKVPKEISSFVLPIGATVNMDGTSLYQAIAVVFLAQFHLVDLSLAQQITIVLTATLASIGTAAVPSAGLVMLIIVLQSVGLNPAWIAIIFPVDRILDMCRTVVNVTGDAAVSTAIAASENKLSV